MSDKDTRLHHVWTESDDSFFQRVDDFGGWPLGKKYVSFHHSDERHCEFGDHYLRTGWWTTVATADDYYWWKISAEKKKKLYKEVRRKFATHIVDEVGRQERSGAGIFR